MMRTVLVTLSLVVAIVAVAPAAEAAEYTVNSTLALPDADGDRT